MKRMKKYTLLLLSILLSFLCLGSSFCFALVKEPKDNPGIEKQTRKDFDWSRNIINIVLDVEASILGDSIFYDVKRGEVRKKDVETYWNEVLKEAKTKIKKPKKLSKETIRKVSMAIDGILKEKGYKYESAQDYSILGFNLLSYGIIREQINCLGYMFLYISIGEHLSLPMSGICMPGHYSIQWRSKINWDSTVAQLCNNDAYIKWAKISQRGIENGTYLRPLSKRKLVGIALLNISQTLRAWRKLEEADEVLKKAICLFPHPDALNDMGLSFKKKGEYVAAIHYFNRAIEIDDNFAKAYSNRIIVLIKTGKNAVAKKDFERLEKIDPDLANDLKIYLINNEIYDKIN